MVIAYPLPTGSHFFTHGMSGGRSPYDMNHIQEVIPLDEVELYREQILRHVSPVITGRFAGYQAAYTREVKVGQPLLIVVFVAAGIAQLIGSLLRMRASRRSFKDLKKGPEFLVTPVRVRDDLGQTNEV